MMPGVVKMNIECMGVIAPLAVLLCGYVLIFGERVDADANDDTGGGENE